MVSSNLRIEPLGLVNEEFLITNLMLRMNSALKLGKYIC